MKRIYKLVERLDGPSCWTNRVLLKQLLTDERGNQRDIGSDRMGKLLWIIETGLKRHHFKIWDSNDDDSNNNTIIVPSSVQLVYIDFHERWRVTINCRGGLLWANCWSFLCGVSFRTRPTVSYTNIILMHDYLTMRFYNFQAPIQGRIQNFEFEKNWNHHLDMRSSECFVNF